MKGQKTIAAIIWAPDNPQTEQQARNLHAIYYNIHYLKYRQPLFAPLKYIPQCLKTWYVLYKQRPSVVYIVNTPVFAPLCVYIYCLFSGTKYIMDVHGHSLIGYKWSWSVFLQRALARRAFVNVVDQPKYYKLFKDWGAKAILLERSPIAVSANGKKPQGDDPNKFTVTIISTFSGDEPLDIVIDAARELPQMTFFILGDTARAEDALLESAPDNVVFPGYLRGDDYWNQLANSYAVITLTTSPYSLASGAVETMALGKPPILSKQPVLTEYFTKGTVFVEHSVESIIDGLHKFRKEEHHLTQEIIELAAEKRQKWKATFKQLSAMIEEIPASNIS